MDDALLAFLRTRNDEDNHAYADVGHRFGGDALLDSHLPMLDMVAALAQKYARRGHAAVGREQVRRTPRHPERGCGSSLQQGSTWVLANHVPICVRCT